MSFELKVFNGAVTSVAFTPTGFLYVAGEFTTYDGDPVDSLVRLTPEGDLDTDFESKLEVSSTVYPPTQLFVTADGGVIAGVGTTRLNILKVGGVADRMIVDGADVPSIVKFFSNGEVDGEWQTGLHLGDVVKAFTPVGEDRVCYVIDDSPDSAVYLVNVRNLETYDLFDDGANAFMDVVLVDCNRLAIIAKELTNEVSQTYPEVKDFTTEEWPLDQRVMLVDGTLTPVEGWTTSAGQPDMDCSVGLYDADWTRLWIGQPLTIDASFGQWSGSENEQHRGMICSGVGYGYGATSEWDLRTEDPVVTSNKQGFEPYTDGTDDDGFPVMARPLVCNPATGSVFATAPFGKFRDVAKTKYTIVEVDKDGVATAFAHPTLTSSGIPKVACAALSPNGNVLVIGGRITEGVISVNAVSGAASTADVVDTVLRSLSLGGGVRGVEWIGFGENLYGKQAAK